MLSVGAGVGVVERRPAVQQVLLWLVDPGPLTDQAPHHLCEDGDAVDDGRVHDLSLA
jgi:hypothetical protein